MQTPTSACTTTIPDRSGCGPGTPRATIMSAQPPKDSAPERLLARERQRDDALASAALDTLAIRAGQQRSPEGEHSEPIFTKIGRATCRESGKIWGVGGRG